MSAAAGVADWWQVELRPAAARIDEVEAWCWAQGALSVTCVPAANTPDVFEPAPGATPGWAQTRLLVLFAGDETEGGLRGRLTAAWDAAGLPGAPAPGAQSSIRSADWQVDAVRDEDWQRSWRQHVQTRCFGGRLWVQTRDTPLPADGVAVLLDPGMAFGTGGHPTTALCLEWLATQLPRGARVVDFGCGSGILAIAAAKLGARVVHALDHDPQARIATADNAGVNGVRDIVQVPEQGSLPDACGDVVLANILAGTLIDLAPELKRLLAPRGALVMSGVLAHQADAVRAAYPEFVFEQDAVSEEWVRIAGRRPAADGV